MTLSSVCLASRDERALICRIFIPYERLAGPAVVFHRGPVGVDDVPGFRSMSSFTAAWSSKSFREKGFGLLPFRFLPSPLPPDLLLGDGRRHRRPNRLICSLMT
jgi:hypothetical protein